MSQDIVDRIQRILNGADERELDATEKRAFKDAIWTIKTLGKNIVEDSKEKIEEHWHTKRYLLFQGETYYAQGGMHDFVMSDDDYQRLMNYAKEMTRKNLINWWHIYDSKTGDTIYKSDTQAYPNDY